MTIAGGLPAILITRMKLWPAHYY